MRGRLFRETDMKTLQDAALKSWKTTAVGWLTFLGTLSACLIAVLDDNPETQAQWNLLFATFTGAVGLTLARDNDKSSEDTGAKQ